MSMSSETLTSVLSSSYNGCLTPAGEEVPTDFSSFFSFGETPPNSPNKGKGFFLSLRGRARSDPDNAPMAKSRSRSKTNPFDDKFKALLVSFGTVTYKHKRTPSEASSEVSVYVGDAALPKLPEIIHPRLGARLAPLTPIAGEVATTPRRYHHKTSSSLTSKGSTRTTQDAADENLHPKTSVRRPRPKALVLSDSNYIDVHASSRPVLGDATNSALCTSPSTGTIKACKKRNRVQTIIQPSSPVTRCFDVDASPSPRVSNPTLISPQTSSYTRRVPPPLLPLPPIPFSRTDAHSPAESPLSDTRSFHTATEGSLPSTPTSEDGGNSSDGSLCSVTAVSACASVAGGGDSPALTLVSDLDGEQDSSTAGVEGEEGNIPAGDLSVWWVSEGQYYASSQASSDQGGSDEVTVLLTSMSQ